MKVKGLPASFRMGRAVLVMLLLWISVFSAGSPVASVGAHSPGAPQSDPAALIVSPVTLTAGGVTILSGSGFLASEQVQIFFDGILKGTIQVLPTGAFGTLLLTVPATTAPGVHTVQAVGVSSRFNAVASITVLAAAPNFSARLSLSPSTIRPGGEVVVDG